MRVIASALACVFRVPAYRVIGASSFVGFLALYLMTLPASYTGGRIGAVALRFLDAKLVALSIAMAALIALIIPLVAYLLKQGQGASKASATGGVLVGVLTPILCCSPLLPIALGLLAGIFPSLVGAFGWRLQGFIATYQTELFVAAILLLGLALYQNARRVSAGVTCRVPADRHVDHASP